MASFAYRLFFLVDDLWPFFLVEDLVLSFDEPDGDKRTLTGSYERFRILLMREKMPSQKRLYL